MFQVNSLFARDAVAVMTSAFKYLIKYDSRFAANASTSRDELNSYFSSPEVRSPVRWSLGPSVAAAMKRVLSYVVSYLSVLTTLFEK